MLHWPSTYTKILQLTAQRWNNLGKNSSRKLARSCPLRPFEPMQTRNSLDPTNKNSLEGGPTPVRLRILQHSSEGCSGFASVERPLAPAMEWNKPLAAHRRAPPVLGEASAGQGKTTKNIEFPRAGIRFSRSCKAHPALGTSSYRHSWIC